MPGLLALMEVPGIAVALWLARRGTGDGSADRPALMPAIGRVLSGKSIVLLLGVMTVVGTLISDLLLMWIEPRLRITGR